jgi:hypothetical protein
MTNKGNSQIGLPCLSVVLAQRENVGVIKRGDQGPDNPVKTRGFIR